MRTARNIFIALLAVADSTLCLFTMPMTLVGILTKYWSFGSNSWILCKVRFHNGYTLLYSDILQSTKIKNVKIKSKKKIFLLKNCLIHGENR